MAKTRYPISKEFFPLDRIAFPVSPRAIAMAKKYMGVPKFVWRDPDLDVESHSVAGHLDGQIEVLVMAPKGIPRPAPCLVDIHGGGFVFEAASHHYRLAMRYAKEAGCIVAFPRYRLAPEHPFPTPQEDSFGALSWVFSQAERLGIDPARVGVSGDSAGGTLAVAACLMARDRGMDAHPLFQLLLYPFLDGRNESDSFRRFTDTPVWNSTLSEKVGPLTNPDPASTPLAYRSPVEAESLAGMPPAYIEVAEFDCLHDDGVLYTRLLREEGIDVELHETRGTMHGFDYKLSAPTTQKMVEQRIAYMKRMFRLP